MRSFFKLMAFGGVLLLLVSTLTACTVASSEVSWQRALDVAPSELVNQAITENFSPSPKEPTLDASVVKAMVLKSVVRHSASAAPLYVFDFNTPTLCGAAGCLYTAYLQREKNYQSVLSVYLNPNLPSASTPLITVAKRNDSRFGLSCMSIAQRTQDNRRIVTLNYCYDGSKFRLVNEERQHTDGVEAVQTKSRSREAS
jgi:hypothetical protein